MDPTGNRILLVIHLNNFDIPLSSGAGYPDLTERETPRRNII